MYLLQRVSLFVLTVGLIHVSHGALALEADYPTKEKAIQSCKSAMISKKNEIETNYTRWRSSVIEGADRIGNLKLSCKSKSIGLGLGEVTGYTTFQRGWKGEDNYDDAFDGMLLFFYPATYPLEGSKRNN